MKTPARTKDSFNIIPASRRVKQLLERARRYQIERIRDAGKHKCIRELAGTANRVTGHNDRILKRPVILHRFYWCKICGKDMK